MTRPYSQYLLGIRIVESSNNYAQHSTSYLGAYQFGEAALIDIGMVNPDGNAFDNNYSGGFTGKFGIDSIAEFLATPAAQDAAAGEWWEKLWTYVRSFDLEFYDFQTLNGVTLSASGMIAGAHLVGIGGLRTYIESGGTTIPADDNGTPITSYIRRFGGHALPFSPVTNHDNDNTVNGGSGRDTLIGFGGNDTLIGNGADDILIGGSGADIFRGGTGNDTFWGNDLYEHAIETGGHDRADYSAAGSRIIVGFAGEAQVAAMVVRDGQGGRDTLYNIEEVIGTSRRDVFNFVGIVPDGYRLTIQAGGGGDTYRESINLLGATTHMNLNIGNSSGTLYSEGSSGRITLLGFHTDIIGSDYDDTIVDDADGDKTIYGGGGDDEITVSVGEALIDGGDGDDIIHGGDEADHLIGGEGANQLFGGDKTDILESNREFGAGGEERLDGGAGADWMLITGLRSGTVLDGGAGDDLIDPGLVTPETDELGAADVEFGFGGGHDLIAGYGWSGGTPSFEDFESGMSYAAINDIVFNGVSLDDATLVWNVTIVDEEYDPGLLTYYYLGLGDLAVVLSDGSSILFKNFVGQFQTFDHHSPFVGPTSFETFNLPGLIFEDGRLTFDDGRPNVEITQGGTSGYDGADAAVAAGLADSGGDDEGTSGDDEIVGGLGDDSLSGGAGDDGFRGSGGNDTIDGGVGTDLLALIGARTDYLISRDAGGGVTIEDKKGLEGKMALTSIEKIYFAGEGEEYEPGDLVGFWGTEDDDALVQGNARDNEVHGLAGSDLLRGLDGNDTLYGGDGADTLEGGAGNDILDGGAGADTLKGGTGDDVYCLVDAGDTASETGGGGSDEIRTNAANYTLATGFERLTGLLATGQTLIGNSAANVLTGGAGADVLNGGSGSDTAAWTWSEAGVTVDIQNAILSGDAAGDTLTSIENLTGGAGDDTLSGTSAANILDGGGGDDLLTGRGGNDIYYVGDSGDEVIELAGQGNDEIRTTLDSYDAVENVETIRYVGTGDFTGFGDDANNILNGGIGDDQLFGGVGYDTLIGGDGADSLYGDDDGDVLDGRAGADYMEGGLGNDNYTVDDAGDVVQEIYDEGVDLVYTTLAAYTLTDDVENLTGNSYDAQELTGNELANLIWAGGSDDLLTGGDGDDELRGNAGNDVIDGGDGDDLIIGNAGIDVLTGGDGADTFRVGNFESEANGYADWILDFVSGTDKIDLAEMDADIWTAGVQDFTLIGTSAFSGTAGELRYEYNGTDTVIRGDWNGDGGADMEIVLAGEVTPLASDFLF